MAAVMRQSEHARSLLGPEAAEDATADEQEERVRQLRSMLS
jgi:hypothetical protein